MKRVSYCPLVSDDELYNLVDYHSDEELYAMVDTQTQANVVNIPLLDNLQQFYLTKCIAIAKNPLEPSLSDSQEATRVCLRVSGLNPVTLSRYPDLTRAIQVTLSRISEIANIEDTFMVPLASCFHQKESIHGYVEKLLASKDPPQVELARRIVDLLQEIEECVICYTGEADTFFSCGHRVCSLCSSRLWDCPFCRAAIQQLLQAGPAKPAARPRWQLVVDLEKFVKLRWTGLLKRSSTLDPRTAQEMEILTENFPSLSMDCFYSSAFQMSEEVICYVSAQIFRWRVLGGSFSFVKWGEEEVRVGDSVKKRITTPSRLIRFLASLANNEPLKDLKLNLRNFNNRFRLWIVQTIDMFQVERGKLEMKQRKGFWVWLFKKLHIREKRFSKYPVAQELGVFVRGNTKLSNSKMGKFNELYKQKDVKLLNFVEEHSELLFRNFRSVLNVLSPVIKVEDWSAMLANVVPKMKQSHLVELIHILENIKDINETLFVYRTKNGSLYWPSEELPGAFDSDGFNRDGFNRGGYDRNGYDKQGYNMEGYDRGGFNRDGYDKEGYNRQGFDNKGFNCEGWDKEGIDSEGYDKDGFNHEGYNREGLDQGGFDRKGYNKEGYDCYGYNSLGFNRRGFNKNGEGQQGDRVTFIHGYDEHGYNKVGFDKEGYSSEGYDRNGFNKEGYNSKGYDRQGYDRKGCTLTERNTWNWRRSMEGRGERGGREERGERGGREGRGERGGRGGRGRVKKQVNVICIPETFIDTSLSLIKNSFKPLPFRLVLDTPKDLNSFKLSRGRPPRVPSWVPLVSAAGDKFKVNPKDKVVIFIHWMNGESRVDLDLSVMMMSKGKYIGTVDYTSTSWDGVDHSGDFVSAPPPRGASEYITFIPSIVLVNNCLIEEMYIMCFSFNKVDFDKMGQAFVGIGVISPDKPGEGPAGSNVLSGCELRGTSQVNFTSKFSFVSHEFTFCNVNVTSNQVSHSVRSNKKLIQKVGERFKDWEAKRSPPSFFKVADTLCFASKEVIFLDGTEKKFFKRRENETNVQFYQRIKNGEVDKEVQEEEMKKILYIGNMDSLSEESTKEWPKESLVVSKMDPKLENVVWSSDPYAAFMDQLPKGTRKSKKV